MTGFESCSASLVPVQSSRTLNQQPSLRQRREPSAVSDPSAGHWGTARKSGSRRDIRVRTRIAVGPLGMIRLPNLD